MKKILIYLAKIAAMLALLIALLIGWIVIVLSMSGGLFEPLTPFQEFLSYVLLAVGAAVFIYVCVKVSRIGTEPPDYRDGFFKKAKEPLKLIIPVMVIALILLAIDF